MIMRNMMVYHCVNWSNNKHAILDYSSLDNERIYLLEYLPHSNSLYCNITNRLQTWSTNRQLQELYNTSTAQQFTCTCTDNQLQANCSETKYNKLHQIRIITKRQQTITKRHQIITQENHVSVV